MPQTEFRILSELEIRRDTIESQLGNRQMALQRQVRISAAQRTIVGRHGTIIDKRKHREVALQNVIDIYKTTQLGPGVNT